MPSLTEKYRPSQWSEVIGQEKVVGRIQALAQRGSLSGRAYWLSGQSGTGKTTIARLIAGDVADPFLIQEVDASALTVAQLRDLESESNLKGFGDKSGRAFIVNEAHGLRKDVIRQLLVTLERIPSHVAWLFTTTSEQQESLFEELADASPLLSRCIRLSLTSQGLCKQAAGVEATPHTFRHQAISWLTRHSGMADAELQLITGHAKRETLAIYQHVALDGQLEERYQKAMREVEI